MKNTMINKMKNSRFGKILRRVVGEEVGAVMMEYVILAVLIAAATVVAIAYFGRTVTGEANVAIDAMASGGNTAKGTQEKIKEASTKYKEEAVNVNKGFSDAKEEAVK